MTPEEISNDRFWLDFPAGFAALLWNMAELSGFEIGEFAPICFGLMLGSPGQLVEKESSDD